VQTSPPPATASWLPVPGSTGTANANGSGAAAVGGQQTIVGTLANVIELTVF
jgi:hypothetical protein